MTLFKQDNVLGEVSIDADKDVVLVMRDDEGEHDFMLHLPPFEGDNNKFPSHIGFGITIAACLYEKDKDFRKLMASKFNQYAREYLDRVYPGQAKEE